MADDDSQQLRPAVPDAVETRNPMVAMEVTHPAAVEQDEPVEAGGWRRRLTRRRLIGMVAAGVLLVCGVAAAAAVFLVYYNPTDLTKLAVPQNMYVTFSAQARNGQGSANGNLYVPDTWAVVNNGAIDGAYASSAYVGTTKFNVNDVVGAASPMRRLKVGAAAAAAAAAVNDAYTIPISAADPNATVISYVGGAAYYQSFSIDDNADASMGCVDDYTVPPLGDLVTALKGASAAPLKDVDRSKLDTACDTLKPIWMARYHGSTYLVCQTSEPGHYKVMGEEFIADVQVNAAGVPVAPAPKPPAGLVCPQVKFPTFKDSRRLRGDELDVDSDAWWSLSAAAQAAARRRLAPARRCLFMHGMGPKTDDAPTSTYTSYWGDAHKKAHCTSTVFLHRNTIGRAWDDESLQDYFCSQAAVNGVISNTNLFTHSMGSLIVAGALASGKCRMDASTKWMHVQGPLLGTKAADFASNLCKNGPGVVVSLANSLGFCVGNNPAAAVNSLRRGYSGRQTFSQLVSYVRNNVDAAMCGRATLGLDKLVGLGLSALHAFVGYGEDSDGLVPWSSCASNMPGRFDDTYKAQFMDAGVHHLDGTCRNGDGWWGDARKPCKWYEKVTA